MLVFLLAINIQSLQKNVDGLLNVQSINKKQNNEEKIQFIQGLRRAKSSDYQDDIPGISRKDVEDYEKAEYGEGRSYFLEILGFIFAFVGVILYIFVGISFATDCCDNCCCCCAHWCEEHGPKSYNFDNRDNDFYSKTLDEFGDLEKE